MAWPRIQHLCMFPDRHRISLDVYCKPGCGGYPSVNVFRKPYGSRNSFTPTSFASCTARWCVLIGTNAYDKACVSHGSCLLSCVAPDVDQARRLRLVRDPTLEGGLLPGKCFQILQVVYISSADPFWMFYDKYQTVAVHFEPPRDKASKEITIVGRA